MNLNELLQKRAALVKQGRDILDKAEAEKRGLNQEEKNKYDAIMADVDSIKEQVKTEERQAAYEKDIQGTQHSNAPKPEPEGRGKKSADNGEYRSAFEHFVRNGKNALDREELRALQEGTTTEGGYLVPQTYEARIIELMAAAGVMRKLASVLSTSSNINIPIETSVGSAGWIAEEGAYGESDEVFGRVTLSSYKGGRIIKVSDELLRDSSFNLEAYLAKKLAQSIGVLQEAAFVAGDGSGKPTGVLNGTHDIEAASTSAITSDELLDLYYALKPGYRLNASWIANDSTIKVLRKLKNGTTGDYMWSPGLRTGDPDILLGRPIYATDGAPAIAADAKVIGFGDMSYYQIVDRVGIEILRLNELYAANGQVGFRGNQRTDGKLTLTEAVKILKMHHS